MYIQGYRSTQKTIVDITEKTAEMDQLKGSTLEDISGMVDQINREFKNKEAQLQPLMQELKVRIVYVIRRAVLLHCVFVTF